MSTLSPLTDQDVTSHSHGLGTPADSCMFCDPSIGFRATSEDALAFREHLDQHDSCHLEYQMWKTTIQDEWLGD